MTTVMWVILVGPVFGGRCGAEALGLGLGLSPGPAYRFALPPGLAAKTTRCLVFDQGRPTSHLHCRGSCTFDPFVFASIWSNSFPDLFYLCYSPRKKIYTNDTKSDLPRKLIIRTERVNENDLCANAASCIIKSCVSMRKYTRLGILGRLKTRY